MSQESLYNIAYLEQTMNLFREIKEQSYARFMELKQGIIADLGCGTGQDVINLSQVLPDTVKVVGVDANEEMISKARSLPQDEHRITFLQGDVELLPFEDAYLSGIRNERLIQHVHHPAQAFGEFYRVMKPGAPLTIVETDWSSLTLYNAPPGFSHRIRNYYMADNVANGSAALNLASYLREAGFEEITMRVYPVVSGSLKQVIDFARLEFILREMQAKQYITSDELAALYESMEYADAQHHFISTVNIVIATAVKG